MITTVLDGLRAAVPDDWTVTHARGAEILTLAPGPVGRALPGRATTSPGRRAVSRRTTRRSPRRSLPRRGADVVVAVVGDRIELVGEGRSTATLELVGGQVALLDALAATGTPVVVVLLASKPLVLPDSALDAAAVVWVANPGMQGGRAIAELLLGAIEPSGRLPISFARHVGQQPTYYNQVRRPARRPVRRPDAAAGVRLRRGAVVHDGRVHRPRPRLRRVGLGRRVRDGEVRGRVTLSNKGSRPALETVQVYVRDLVTSASWADKELKSFSQVMVDPGASVTVDVAVPVSACSIVDASGVRVVEPGRFELLVGPSSRDEVLLTAAFEVVDEPVRGRSAAALGGSQLRHRQNG